MATRRKLNWKIIRISLLNVLVMLGLAYYWLSLPHTFGDEAFFIKWSSLVQKSLIGIDPKPNPEEVIFIDISGSKTTIQDTDALSFLPDSNYHRIVITDRKDLTSLFRIMNRFSDDIPFVLCDILFQDSTRYDATLEKEMQRLGNKLLTVSHLQNGKDLISPVLDLPNALATYQTSNSLFLKFPLILGHGYHTIPLEMYTQLYQKDFKKWGPFYFIGGRLSLPSPIVDYKVRSSDFRVGQSLEESNFAIYPLGTILESSTFMDDQALKAYFKDKIVMIGDFKTDLHDTPFGKTPGLLLIYNAYLTLVSKQHEIHFLWILFLSVSFFILSYRIFADIKVSRPRWLANLLKTQMGQYVLNALDEMGLLIIITLLSYFLFNIHINILILFFYLKIVEWIWKKVSPSEKSKKSLKPIDN